MVLWPKDFSVNFLVCFPYVFVSAVIYGDQEGQERFWDDVDHRSIKRE